MPGILRRTRVYLELPATAWVFCRFPQFCLRFCPRPALRLRETRDFPEWSTKHPLFSLEISGNAKCWGPSVFLFVCRKTCSSPSPGDGVRLPTGLEKALPVMNECATRMLRAALLMFCASPQTAARESCCEWCWAKPSLGALGVQLSTSHPGPGS